MLNQVVFDKEKAMHDYDDESEEDDDNEWADVRK